MQRAQESGLGGIRPPEEEEPGQEQLWGQAPPVGSRRDDSGGFSKL